MIRSSCHFFSRKKFYYNAKFSMEQILRTTPPWTTIWNITWILHHNKQDKKRCPWGTNLFNWLLLFIEIAICGSSKNADCMHEYTGVLISPYAGQERNKLHSPQFMELGVSLPHSQESTTCPYPSQIEPFLCPLHFWQVHFFSFLVGLRTYQHAGKYKYKY